MGAGWLLDEGEPMEAAEGGAAATMVVVTMLAARGNARRSIRVAGCGDGFRRERENAPS